MVNKDALAARGAEFEDKLTKFREDSSTDGDWTIELSEEQINGWLAVELPRRFKRWLPNRIHEPRIAIDSGQCHVACLFIEGGTRIVLTMSFDLEPGEKPNELKFKVLSAKIGSVPGLEHEAVGQIAQAAYRSRAVRLRWLRRDVEPEAIVRIADRWFEKDRQVQIDQIEFTDGALLVSGRSSQRPPRPKPKRRRSVAARRANESR